MAQLQPMRTLQKLLEGLWESLVFLIETPLRLGVIFFFFFLPGACDRQAGGRLEVRCEGW